jgi:hypothetical protein
MAQRPPTSSPGEGNLKRIVTQRGNRSRLLIILIALGALLIVVIATWNKRGTYTNVPRDVQIQYVPSQFKPNIDEEMALAILSNPYRYNREFSDLVRQVNLALLDHVVNRMNLSDSLQMVVREEYEKHHPYLRRLYFNEFTTLQDSTSQLYQQWYQSEATDAVGILREVAGKYTCFLVNHIIATVMETTDGRLSVMGSNVNTPCGVAVQEALQPLTDRLKERAAIQDFARSKGLLEERVEQVTAELATLEIRDRKGLSKQLQTKIWGFSVSSTEMEVSAISVLKIGFNLEKYLDIQMDASSKTVRVTLPEPEILSHEVYPKIDKLDIGWLREVQEVDFNKNFNLLRKEFRREALESDAMDKAKGQATEIMNTLLGPLLMSIDRTYQLEVNFKKMGEDVEFPVDDEVFDFD